MKYLAFEHEGRSRVGVIHGEDVVALDSACRDIGELLASTESPAELADRAVEHSSDRFPLSAVSILQPIAVTRNVFCVGLNYRKHIAEGAAAGRRTSELPTLPVWFSKATTSVCGPFDDLDLDPTLSSEFDWEAELAIVVGRGGRHIDPARAREHIFGYTVFNDVSARDIQHRFGGQFFLGKSVDRSSPIGPYVVTGDELDPDAARVTCSLNGNVMQDGSTADLIFGIDALIADLSRVVTLQTGDIIATGTPAGVGSSRNPQIFMAPGDVLETSVDGIGTMRNVISAG